MKDYLLKMKGGGQKPPRAHPREAFWALVGSATGLGLCAMISAAFFEPRDSVFLIGSFGASAVLVYAASNSPFSQPRNLLGGHVLSAFVGVASFKLLGDGTLAVSAGVSLAIALMVLTHTVHPPGGATALIAITGGDKVHSLGFMFPLVPVGVGALVLLTVALIVNNLSRHRRYPHFWF
ncbi:MAG: HPP family protein [Actinomycetota bacterium]|nr:HPP family protein [Actinomycetota bacterium]